MDPIVCNYRETVFRLANSNGKRWKICYIRMETETVVCGDGNRSDKKWKQ